MKILYFIGSAPMLDEDAINIKHFREQGHKVIAVDGRQIKGFQDSCDAVYLSGEFEHVEKWAVSAGVKVMKPEAKVKQEQEPDKPRRGRRKAEPESEQDQAEE